VSTVLEKLGKSQEKRRKGKKLQKGCNRGKRLKKKSAPPRELEAKRWGDPLFRLGKRGKTHTRDQALQTPN